MLRGVLLFTLCIIVTDAFTGDTCVVNGVTGVCVHTKNCRSALQSTANTQICSSVKGDSVVCCLDHMAPGSVATANPSRPQRSTTEYVPKMYDYEITGENEEHKTGKTTQQEESKCGPVDPTLTSPKTGQKAWDKCVEYQEKLVYPCKKSTALIQTYQRRYDCYHNAEELIVGGENATRHEFPHMVLLGYQDGTGISWSCGGSLISESFVLTAGHCVTHQDFGDVKYVSVGVLARREVDSSNTYEVKRSIRHPKYRIGVYNDIALLELDKEVNLDSFTVPACLHVGDQIKSDRALATGWGLLEDHGATPSDVLQKVIVKKIRKSECERDYPKRTLITRTFDSETQLCYGDRDEKKDTCQADSGGPLQIKHKKINCMYLVIGVTSGGHGCALRNKPGLYSKVSHHINWIESVVWP